ncbi:peptidase inhibitor family I36 protein [Nonomuraea fuscirosea]|uniref:peptidase inhibitor family I36 protein n=1 Tax=Nonomuraea fuscirosea TaxID=1291556 RepID=UPI00343470CC
MRKPLVTALAGAFFVATAGVAAQAAQAEPARWSGCPMDEFCVYEGPHGSGRVATFRTGSFNLAHQGLHNGGRSAWNRTDHPWCWEDKPTQTFDPLQVVRFAKRLEDVGAELPIRAVHQWDNRHCRY